MSPISRRHSSTSSALEIPSVRSSGGTISKSTRPRCGSAAPPPPPQPPPLPPAVDSTLSITLSPVSGSTCRACSVRAASLMRSTTASVVSNGVPSRIASVACATSLCTLGKNTKRTCPEAIRLNTTSAPPTNVASTR